MFKHLRYLPMSEVVEGMVLGTPLILAEHGVSNFSLPAGHALTDSNIRQIALRHGEFVCVVEDDPRSDEERASEQAQFQARLDTIFSLADHDKPAIKGLYRAVLAYRSL